MDLEQQKIDFKKMTTGLNQWAWVFNVNSHQMQLGEKQTLTIVMDNDQTFLMIDDEWFEFFESIGQMPGIIDLLQSQRINCEHV